MSDFRLKVFQHVAKNLSFTKASQELFISQPAITKHIQELESTYQVRLFDRLGNKITLTEAGKLLLQHSERILDDYKRLAYDNAKLSYEKCKDDYNRNISLHQGEAISDTQLRDIKMAFENATIQLENAKKQWDDTKITAPFSGYITTQNTELGAYVNPGTVIAGIADISDLKVILDVSESNAYELREGQQVNIIVDINSQANYTGKISNISPKASASHTYPVEIIIPNNRKEKLKAGTYVNVSVNMGKSGKTLMIPRDAIVSSVKDPSVYVVNNNEAKLVKITTGRNFNSKLEVAAGLNEGDKVVTNGQINLTDGAKVAILN